MTDDERLSEIRRVTRAMSEVRGNDGISHTDGEALALKLNLIPPKAPPVPAPPTEGERLAEELIYADTDLENLGVWVFSWGLRVVRIGG